MGDLFFNTFPTLQLKKELHEQLEDVEVTGITSSKSRGVISVSIISQRLLHKAYIYQLEEAIKRQLFYKLDYEIKVIESFKLSAQYDLAGIWNIYRDSMCYELSELNPLLGNIFRRASLELTGDNKGTLYLVDSVPARENTDRIMDYLKLVFEKRCGVEAAITIDYVEHQNHFLKEESDMVIQNQVKAVMDRIDALSPKNPDGEDYAFQDKSSEKEKEKAKRQASDKSKVEDKAKTSAADQKNTVAKTAEAPKEGEKSAFKSAGDRAKWGKNSFTKRSQDMFGGNYPGVLYGKDFPEEDTIPLDQVVGPIGTIVFRGQIIATDVKEIKNERSIYTFVVTDFTDSIACKIFVANEALPEAQDTIKKGVFVKIKGNASFDTFEREVTISYIAGIKKISDFTTKRMDNSARKRVELHCHTKMSDMDAVCDVKDIIKRAKEWGHTSLAITDHGVVQAFTEANHAVERGEFKILYGMEAYLVDDLRDIVENPKGQSLRGEFVVFDLETTGFSSARDRIIEIGAVKVIDGNIVDRFSTFVNPKRPIPFRIEKLTGIKDAMVMDAPQIEEVLPRFLEFSKDAVMVAHNAGFDIGFIRANAARMGIDTDFTVVDTVSLARVLLPSLGRYKLDTVAKTLKISLENHHRAVDDAECTALIFQKFVKMLMDDNILSLDDVNSAGILSVESIRKLPYYHAVLIAKNDIGRINLYRLVSESHLKYFHRRPLVPKSLLNKYREGLILGSACEAGELYRAIHDNKQDDEIASIVDYYDYLEIQPVGNNQYMIAKEDDWVSGEEDIREMNRKVVKLGEQFNKPVVATCDVHFLDPEDEVYRRIIQKGNGFDDADNQAPLYLRTTEEMLAEFEYLGTEKAREIVIDNTNMIADMCEYISPVRPDKCPPVIEDSDKTLTDICYSKAHEIYGEDLPPVVEARLERELNSIISNGYAVMYIIAQKLVWKSNDDGYLVGSRGSVGSSFVATMAGITEVNPLSPHYYCSECHYYDFDSDEVKAFAGMGGCDMPDKECPVCGAPLKKDGFDIPFETFLGFKGDKEPDIDLNFSGEYQANAHKYTEVIFGKGQTFKAGTIGTLADKTVYGYIKKYYEEKGIDKRRCEIERLVQGCLGVRRTTGQHPGGIVVLPHGEDINTFTPVQHPANDMTTDIITTHFDYHSIDHNLLKLDILGHDDPTMIRMLEDLTGINAREIPLDDKEVMSLFTSTKALGINPEDIAGCPVGSLGVPEFGTKFVIDMLVDTKPQAFSDLIRIAGLGHGTAVWLGNAQELVRSGKATISTAICTRDDIMTYLINKGLDPAMSFSIMENVRKGKVAGGKCKDWPSWKEEMLAHDVPDWYVWSCEKIEYMFPKAHAAAYVMMAWRIAYFKINYPLEYYAAYFSIRAKGFDYEMMCFGREKLEAEMEAINNKGDITANEENILKTGAVVREMYARGFEFRKIDVYKAKADRFTIVDGQIMPSFLSIGGMGDKAAEMVEIESAKGSYLSKDDFRDRTKVSKNLTDLMCELGILEDMPESNQLSLFDL